MHHFDGCMFGLRSQAAATRGTLLRKPWSIASTADLTGICRLCDRSHAHAKTQGSDTKLTEGYTEDLVDQIHACWRASALR